jgi:sugar/nucleoside kinase (ribokinase family)
MSLLIVGSVAFDSIQTPFGKINKTLGGSASYFSLAASFFERPSVMAVVGGDFTHKHRLILERKGVDLSGLQTAKGKSFHWGGKYSFDLNNRDTLFTHLNVFEHFKPKLSAHHKTASHVFLGNIHPKLQLEVLRQIKKPKLVGLDTMNFWIEKTHKDLAKVLKLADIFVINDSEARELSKEHNLMKAAGKIIGMMKITPPRPSPHKGRGTATLIIKRGEYGLLMFRRSDSPPFKGGVRGGYNNRMQIFHLPGFPLEDVIDPTGAGDSFAGGFMGYLSKTGDHSWQNLKRACVAGSVLASFSVEKLGTQRLQELAQSDINRRFKEFKKLTHFENH